MRVNLFWIHLEERVVVVVVVVVVVEVRVGVGNARRY